MNIHELAMMVNLGSLTNNTTQYSHANLSENIRVERNQSGKDKTRASQYMKSTKPFEAERLFYRNCENLQCRKAHFRLEKFFSPKT